MNEIVGKSEDENMRTTMINLSTEGAERLLRVVANSNIPYIEARELAKLVWDYAKLSKELREVKQ